MVRVFDRCGTRYAEAMADAAVQDTLNNSFCCFVADSDKDALPVLKAALEQRLPCAEYLLQRV